MLQDPAVYHQHNLRENKQGVFFPLKTPGGGSPQPLAINTLNTFSITQPSSYADGKTELEQFSPHDNRRSQQIAEALVRSGLQPVWKDWDRYLGRSLGSIRLTGGDHCTSDGRLISARPAAVFNLFLDRDKNSWRKHVKLKSLTGVMKLAHYSASVTHTVD